MRRVREYLLPCVLVALAVGIVINFTLLVPALGRLSSQANDGRVARMRQCDLYPVSLKLYQGAAKYHVISAADLKTYVDAVPRNCPHRH